WVWGMGMSVVAHQLRGDGQEHAAGRALRVLGALGVLVAAVVGGLLVALGAGEGGLAAFVVCQVAAMTATGVLIFYAGEALLAAALAPAVIAGSVHVASGFRADLVRPAVAM